jgi:hypothetical protein
VTLAKTPTSGEFHSDGRILELVLESGEADVQGLSGKPAIGMAGFSALRFLQFEIARTRMSALLIR